MTVMKGVNEVFSMRNDGEGFRGGILNVNPAQSCVCGSALCEHTENEKGKDGLFSPGRKEEMPDVGTL